MELARSRLEARTLTVFLTRGVELPMADAPNKDLLAQLAGHGHPGSGLDPWAALDATKPDHEAEEEPDAKLAAMLDRIKNLTAQADGAAPAAPGESEPSPEHLRNTFVPVEPESFRAAGLTDSEVESLILKFLLARGDVCGRDIAEQIKL